MNLLVLGPASAFNAQIGDGEPLRPAATPDRLLAVPSDASSKRRFAVAAISIGLAFYLLHLPFLSLPYFWDEAAQFVPAARDILYGGTWIPTSTTPNIHPPAVMAYLALIWRLAGQNPLTTRSAMLLLAVLGGLCAFLLASELCRHVPGRPDVLAVALLLVTPLFFAQSMLAQLDVPALLFTSLALWLFLRGKLNLAAAACVALVLVKETGLVVPLVFGSCLMARRRWREAARFTVPALALALWIALLEARTGYWTGSAEFQRFNIFYPLNPVRLILAALRRLYYLFVSGFHWIGAAAILYVWKKTRLFQTPAWTVAWLVVLAHVLLMTFTGGAVLERYLLPVLPVLYCAMACGISQWRRPARIVASAALLAGLAAGNRVNPFYPFPYENNLAFADFVGLHQSAAQYLAHYYPGISVFTAWPLTLELSRPELGYVPRRIAVASLPNFAPRTLAGVSWDGIRIFVAFSRDWDSPVNPMRYPPLLHFWERSYEQIANVPRDELHGLVPFPLAASFSRAGQWVDIYVNPAPASLEGDALRASDPRFEMHSPEHAGERRAEGRIGNPPGTFRYSNDVFANHDTRQSRAVSRKCDDSSRGPGSRSE
jgi:Dolichyl-phosphate-mannose-protein mannosyltransferase